MIVEKVFNADLKDYHNKLSSFAALYNNGVKIENLLSEGVHKYSELKAFFDILPSKFKDAISDENYKVKVVYRGEFYKLDVKVDNEYVSKKIDFDGSLYFDLTNLDLREAFNALRSLEEGFKRASQDWDYFCNEMMYSRHKYVEIEKIEIPAKDYYDGNYSMTKEESEAVDKWIAKHEKKHKKDKVYLCAGMESKYKIVFGSTNIGVYGDCICSKCEEQRKILLAAGKIKEAEKLDYAFSFKELG